MDLGKSIPLSLQPLEGTACPGTAARRDAGEGPRLASSPQASAPRPAANSAGSPYRVLITDCGYKHAIALAQYIRRELPGVHLTGHREKGLLLPRLYGCFQELISGGPLEAVLDGGFQQVIPVGAESTLTVARLRPDLAVLPSPSVLDSVYSKFPTLQLAGSIGIPVPRTQAIRSLQDLVPDEVNYPCVLKADGELAPGKRVAYCRDRGQLLRHAERMLAALGESGSPLLVQEYIEGPGHGFFALLDHGEPLRWFMHQRLREFPASGGISTAAAAYYSPRLEELGRRLLQALQWNGVAMAEFKYDVRRRDFVLLEVNGKFWGSLELALCAGINFGADLIRLHRHQPLPPTPDYNRRVRFYWPLDGDLLTLWRTGRIYPGVFDYFRPGAVTNLGQSKRADWLKFFHNVLQLLKGR